MNVSPQRELIRRRYLDAMGVTCYLARERLPGAATAPRLAVRPRPAVDTPALAVPGAAPAEAPSEALRSLQPPQAAVEAAPLDEVVAAPRASDQLVFSLAAIFAGGIAWLEDLQGRPLAGEQVALIQAMARAVSGSAELEARVQFDWPPHHNSQFDLGPDAARAGLGGFLARQLEQRGSRGIVLLGAGNTGLVPVNLFSGLPVVTTRSTAEMLAEPELKREVWQDLQPLVARR